jgi:chromate transporter
MTSTADDTRQTPAAPTTPRSLADVFLSFNRLALQGFGGVIAIAQIELVERRRWLSREQFVEMLSIAQVLPGPNIVNLSLMLGDRWFGVRGAIAALAGLIVVPLVIVMALTLVYARFADVPQVAGALRGMGAVAAGLVIATALKLAGTLRRSPLGRIACIAIVAVTLLAIAWQRWPLVWVLAIVGSVAVAIAWTRLPR